MNDADLAIAGAALGLPYFFISSSFDCSHFLLNQLLAAGSIKNAARARARQLQCSFGGR